MKRRLTILLSAVSLIAAAESGRAITHLPKPRPCTGLLRPCPQPPPCVSGPNKPCTGTSGVTTRR